MSDVQAMIFGCSVEPEDAQVFLEKTKYNPAAAIHWFVQQVITGKIEPEEYMNALGGE